jgi:hypothetical protein
MRIYFIIAFLLATLSAQSQVRISGQVSHFGEPLDEVTIKVVENGSVLRTMLADRRGRFDVEVPFNRYYTLVFVKPFMFPMSIEVDTRINADDEVVYEVPLKMTMFYRYANMEDPGAKHSIGVIKQVGVSEESFAFVANQAVIDSYIPLMEESQQRELDGEEAVETGMTGLQMELPALSESTSESETQQPTKPIQSEAINKTRPQASDMRVDPANRQTERFEQVEAAADAQRTDLMAMADREAKAAEARQVDLDAYERERRDLRREWEASEQAEREAIAEARLRKQVLAPATGTSPVSTTTTTNFKLIKHSFEPGYIWSEERLIVEEQGKRHVYVKTRYDWLLFDVVYFSKDEEEISEEDYDQVRKLAGI